MRAAPSAAWTLAAFAALAAPAGARSYIDPTPRPEPRPEPHVDDNERPDEREAAPPRRPGEPWRPVDYLSERWRLAAGVGARFGSFLVDNAGVGTVIPGHLAAGWRKGRLWLFAEYSTA